MRSVKTISKGEEIFNDYGQLPRSDLLRRYGYVTNNYAAYDVAEIATQTILYVLSNEQQLASSGYLQQLSREELDRRVELAQREGVYEDSYDLAHPGPDGPSIPDELLALLYLLLLDNENFAAIETSKTTLPSRSKLATIRVGQVLAIAFCLRTKEYPTSIQEDQAILQAGNISNRKAMAVQVRLGEKIVLEKAIQEANSFTTSNRRMRYKGDNSNGVDSKNKRKLDNDEPERKRGRFR